LLRVSRIIVLKVCSTAWPQISAERSLKCWQSSEGFCYRRNLWRSYRQHQTAYDVLQTTRFASVVNYNAVRRYNFHKEVPRILCNSSHPAAWERGRAVVNLLEVAQVAKIAELMKRPTFIRRYITTCCFLRRHIFIGRWLSIPSLRPRVQICRKRC
jgi:hypothetical protein